MKALRHQRGLTFIELIISIVVIGIAVSGVLLVMNTTVSKSADPMLQHQALAVAEAYLEEILTREFGPPSGASTRQDYATVGDYQNLPSGPPANQFGDPLGLAGYTVTVQVQDEVLDGVAMQRVDVSVDHASGLGMAISGYKADY